MMQRAQPQRQSILIAPEPRQRHSQAQPEHPGVEQAPTIGKTLLDFSKDKVHVHPPVLCFPSRHRCRLGAGRTRPTSLTRFEFVKYRQRVQGRYEFAARAPAAV